MKPEHTQTPWRQGNFSKKVTEQDHQVMRGDMVVLTCNQNFIEQAKVDAAFVVLACNAHEQLVASVRMLRRFLCASHLDEGQMKAVLMSNDALRAAGVEP